MDPYRILPQQRLNRTTPSAVVPLPSTTKGRRLRCGRLHLLPSVPLDIVHEILGFLEPRDLLALSRTSRAFQCLLKSGSAAFLWRQARQNVGNLPDPPSDVNEIQYAALAFGTECSSPGCQTKARHTIWHLRIRLCGSCRIRCKPVTLSESEDWRMIRKILKCDIDALYRYLPQGPFFIARGHITQGFHDSQLKAFRKALEAIPDSEREAYLTCIHHRTTATNKHTALVVEWQLQTRRERANRLKDARIARADMIRDSMMKAGFSEEIEHFTWKRISGHQLIKSSQPLTDQVRPRVLKQIQGYMQCWRELLHEERVYSARRRVFAEAWFQFTSNAFSSAPAECPYLPLPPVTSIGFSPLIDPLIRQSGDIQPESLLAQLHRAFDLAYDYILQWHKDVRRELASLLPGYVPKDDDIGVHSRLKLATSIFRCTSRQKCQVENRPLTYPDILSHPCFYVPTWNRLPKDPSSICRRTACAAMGGSVWSCRGRVQSYLQRDALAGVISCSGKDPRTTTIVEMDSQDARVMCRLCESSGLIIYTSWRCAVQHSASVHPTATVDDQWLSLTPTMVTGVRQMESRKLSYLDEKELNSFTVCLLCPRSVTSWLTPCGFRDVFEHIYARHGITPAVRGRDYAPDTRICPPLPTPIKLRLP